MVKTNLNGRFYFINFILCVYRNIKQKFKKYDSETKSIKSSLPHVDVVCR